MEQLAATDMVDYLRDSTRIVFCTAAMHRNPVPQARDRIKNFNFLFPHTEQP